MRHGRRSQRLSRVQEQRDALVHSLVRHLVVHDQIRTTHARAKEAQRLADRLVSFGKEGSVHARRKALRILQDRGLVKRLFAEVAPRFVNCPGGYTRVVRLGSRRGDGAQQALLAFSRVPVAEHAVPEKPKAPAPKVPSAPPKEAPTAEAPKKPKKLFEGLRSLWTRKKDDHR